MALTLTTAVQNDMADALVDLIDVGTPNGILEIGTSGMALLLVTNNFAATAFGAASGGIATAAAIADGTAVATGTAAEARIRDGDALDIITGLTVGTSGTDIVLTGITITSGDVISITAGTVTMPAS